MSAVVRSAEGMQKLNNLYHFSWGVGGITIVVLIVFLLLIWLRYHQLSRHFDQWLSQRAQQFYIINQLLKMMTIFILRRLRRVKLFGYKK